ncbi:hypothetical protein BG08_6023 (plasmid) [Bacillus thuringiensis serovar kurstaki]|nr:hypothetical protein BG08_6023 [Bacillus thuringiensis serovar kurstaki]EOP30888.1 hypothetical protein IGG_03071 [Bacillus cereus HuB13-1]KKB29765.1 hypothetical protein Btm27_03300 [Bacillus thuringiensis serovar mexicanensis]
MEHINLVSLVNAKSKIMDGKRYIIHQVGIRLIIMNFIKIRKIKVHIRLLDRNLIM